eukprot:GHUV01056457.1.p1 GENE.GHUV01056457.1~~GHUV01056457.1.p1  ORF type:complete len:126 (-),score=19.16 GHUV01056457.1:543-920(-)
MSIVQVVHKWCCLCSSLEYCCLGGTTRWCHPHTRASACRETDEAISEPQFINLSYVQAQHDYLAGNYPVVREDAAQMAALQIHAEHGPGLDQDPDCFMAGIERFVTRQVLMTRPRDEWRTDVGAR